jgi:hypothetical protein
MPVKTRYIQTHRKRRVRFDRLDLHALWQEFTQHVYAYAGTARTDFLNEVRALTTEPDKVQEEVEWCFECSAPGRAETMHPVANGQACEVCIDNFIACSTCGGLHMWPDTVDDGRGNTVAFCDSCRDDACSYCDECEAWYLDTRADDHKHGRCDCESPAQRFRVRDNGNGMLDNDRSTHVSLPAGEISQVGMDTIAQYLYHQVGYRQYMASAIDRATYEKYVALASDLPSLGTKWQEKRGNFTKRLSRLAHTKHGLKLSPEVISHVGNIGRDHSAAVDFTVEVTRNLNLPPSHFAHPDSCWWTDYAEGRCMLKSNGGFALRSFDEYGHVTGRAWVMPLKQESGVLTPTFETEEPDAFIVFNGYEALNGYPSARVLSHMAGMTYRKVTFTCRPMYINSNMGFIVAPEEIAERYTDGSLSLSLETHSDLYETEQQEVLVGV